MKTGLFFMLAMICFAANVCAEPKTLEVTTYYPAPHGEYENLSSSGESNFATTSGNVGIGTTSPQAILDLDVTSRIDNFNVPTNDSIFLPPRMTTVQRDNINAPVDGAAIYNTTTHKLNTYNTAVPQWEELSAGGGGVSEAGWSWVCNRNDVAACRTPCAGACSNVSVGITGIYRITRRVNFTETYTVPPYVVATQLGCKRYYDPGVPTSMADFTDAGCTSYSLSTHPWIITDVDVNGFTFSRRDTRADDDHRESVYYGFTYIVVEAE